MKKTMLLTLFLSAVSAIHAQTTINRDPVIAGMVTAISAEKLEQHVRTLAAFAAVADAPAPDTARDTPGPDAS